ncbi:MAG: hypothetical protein HY290_03030, partial [Planctomycetia bacterium]|nr:hypothetical protein [Planctomycetia bacterium]
MNVICKLSTWIPVMGILLAGVSLRAEVQVGPAAVSLTRPEDAQQLVVTEITGTRQRDLTREVR